jgi:hypothetical protein
VERFSRRLSNLMFGVYRTIVVVTTISTVMVRTQHDSRRFKEMKMKKTYSMSLWLSQLVRCSISFWLLGCYQLQINFVSSQNAASLAPTPPIQLPSTVSPATTSPRTTITPSSQSPTVTHQLDFRRCRHPLARYRRWFHRWVD